jgi:hypothetical protein
MAKSLAGCLLVFALLISGCGESTPTTAPVTGTVTYNGTAVEGATVTFLAENSSHMAEGKTDANGKFTLKLNMGEKVVDGAMLGTNNVAVIKLEGGTTAPTIEATKEAATNMTLQPPAMTSDHVAKNLLPEKYQSPMTSNLKYTVEAGKTNDFKIELVD